MSAKNAVTTIVANNYLGFALTLCESLRENTNLDLYILLADGFNSEIDYSIYPYNFVDAKDLNISRMKELTFKYDVVEFSTSLKPFMLEYLMVSKGYEKVFYIDPDICFFDKFDNLIEDLGAHSAMLTPHLVDPSIGLGNSQFEKTCLLDGSFNLGFIGLNNSAESHLLLHWWEERLLEFCYNDEKYFTDQKWANLMPTLFDDIYICRKKKYNFAEWNFYERRISEENGIYYIKEKDEKSRLSFCHFSGYKASEPTMFLKKDRIIMHEEDRNVITALYARYRELLEKNDFQKYSSIKYPYNAYDNGIVITELHRRLYRSLKENGYQIEDPFSTQKGSLYQIFEANKLLIQETDLKRTVFDNSQVSKKTGIITKMNAVMRLVMKIVGVKKYCMLLRYFCHYCTINDQVFLLKKMPKDKYIG